ncbi:hypothetical protein [Antrihabitans stalactiti]|uniref:Uncharacterized protein n=1 Tax=Antrihabitans stalactiti TaxID=2584121 RepID=A0A848KII5_9NOCA|nr:hypothetical protein [Antrihabitans stalactiti]NMN95697.1 hypothetical protein [Antrihabitans stalactiti]
MGTDSIVSRFVDGWDVVGAAAIYLADKSGSGEVSLSIERRAADLECGLPDSHDRRVIARIATVAAGYPLGEALRRVYAYAQACSDAVVIRAAEQADLPVLEFREVWVIDAPVAPGCFDPVRVLVTVLADQELSTSCPLLAATFAEVLGSDVPSNPGVQVEIDRSGVAAMTVDDSAPDQPLQPGGISTDFCSQNASSPSGPLSLPIPEFL